MKLALHSAACAQALRRLKFKPVSSLLSALVIAIALTLPMLGYVLLDNVAILAHGVSGKPEISVFLHKDGGPNAAFALQSRLVKEKGLARIRFVRRDQALKDLAARGGFADVAGELAENPLPDAFILEPRGDDPVVIEALAKRLQAMPEVAHVQLDAEWINRMQALITLAQRAVWLLAGLLGCALIIITFNTIRLQILTQRHEISVSLLLGATRAYVRRPFLYFGAWQGLIGGVLCWVIVFALIRVIGPSLQSLAASYSITLNFTGPALIPSAGLLLLATTLGWLGAAFSVRRHLHDGVVD